MKPWWTWTTREKPRYQRDKKNLTKLNTFVTRKFPFLKNKKDGLFVEVVLEVNLRVSSVAINTFFSCFSKREKGTHYGGKNQKRHVSSGSRKAISVYITTSNRPPKNLYIYYIYIYFTFFFFVFFLI